MTASPPPIIPPKRDPPRAPASTRRPTAAPEYNQQKSVTPPPQLLLGIRGRAIADLIAFEQMKICKIAKLVFFEKWIRSRIKLFVIHGQFD